MSDKIIRIRCTGAATIEYFRLEPFQGELKSLTDENYQRLKGRIIEHGFTAPIHVWKTDGHLYTLDGHQRCRVLKRMEEDGFEIPPVPVDWVEADTYQQAKRILLAHASQYGKVEGAGLLEQIKAADISVDELKASFNFHEINFKAFALEHFGQQPDALGKHGSMSDTFLVPPFSVLDARQGYWQDRKRQWLALGIQSELGRGGGGKPLTWGIAPSGMPTRPDGPENAQKRHGRAALNETNE